MDNQTEEIQEHSELDHLNEEEQQLMNFLQEAIKIQFARMQKEIQAQLNILEKDVKSYVERTGANLQMMDKNLFEIYVGFETFKTLLVGTEAGTIITEKKFEELFTEVAKKLLENLKKSKEESNKEG